MRLFLLVFVIVAVPGYCTDYSNVSTINGITIGDQGVRVKLDSMKSVEGCANQGSYLLSDSLVQFDAMLSTLLSAKLSGQKLSLQLTGCASMANYSYPKINHIYFCDTSYCS